MHYFEFAIKMELDGEKYYTKQAEKYKGTNLHTIFLILAKDEIKHAEILKARVNKLTPELLDNDSFAEYKNIFQDADDFSSAIKLTLDQLDIYSMALEKEQEAIDLYKKMLSRATSDEDKEIFKYLIKEEKAHYAILDDIVSHVSRAVEWVESAEFGIREEY